MTEKTRLTKQKQQILTVLRQAREPMTAAEIFEQAVLFQPRLARSTVYRNLETMEQAGTVVCQLLENGQRIYAVAEEHAHHHYMICRACHRLQDLPSCPLEHLEEQIRNTTGFEVTEHVIQIYGYCEKCAKKHAR